MPSGVTSARAVVAAAAAVRTRTAVVAVGRRVVAVAVGRTAAVVAVRRGVIAARAGLSSSAAVVARTAAHCSMIAGIARAYCRCRRATVCTRTGGVIAGNVAPGGTSIVTRTTAGQAGIVPGATVARTDGTAAVCRIVGA